LEAAAATLNKKSAASLSWAAPFFIQGPITGEISMRRRSAYAIVGNTIEDADRRTVAILKPGLPLSQRDDLRNAPTGKQAREEGYEEGYSEGRREAFKENPNT
jgi:hypothetical protein